MNDAKNSNVKTTSTSNMNDAKEIATRYMTQEMAVLEVYGRIGKITCKMSNLSKSGAFFEIVNSSFIPKKGDLVRVSVNLGQIKKRYNLEAEVVWCRGLGLGVNFIHRDRLLEQLSSKAQAL